MNMCRFVYLVIVAAFYLSFVSGGKRKSDPCIIKQHNSILNVTDISRVEGYKIPYKNRTYYVNICRESPYCGKNISACVYDPRSNKTYVVGLVKTISSIPDVPLPTIKYTFKKKGIYSNVEIKLKCSVSKKEATLAYIPPEQKKVKNTATVPPIRNTTLNFQLESKKLCSKPKIKLLLKGKKKS